MSNTKQTFKVANDSFYGTGKRKSAIAKVWIFKGALFDKDIEKEKIKSLLKKYFDLTDQKLEELFSLSLIINDDSNDIQQFTRKLNENLDYDEKLEIIEMMWKIIIADGRIDDYENSLIRKISGLLYVQDSDVGKIKNKN